MKKQLISLVLSMIAASAGAAGTQEPELTGHLEGWSDTHLPELQDAARSLLQPPFTVQELMDLAEMSVQAAQELKGVLAGKQRAHVAQAALVLVVKETCPAGIAAWAVPLLSGEGLVQLIEAAFLKLFPEKGPELASVTPDHFATA